MSSESTPEKTERKAPGANTLDDGQASSDELRFFHRTETIQEGSTAANVVAAPSSVSLKLARDTISFRKNSLPQTKIEISNAVGQCTAAGEEVKSKMIEAFHLLQNYHQLCEEGNGMAWIKQEDITSILEGFEEAFEAKGNIFAAQAERNLKQKFKAHKDVYDEGVQQFLTGTFLNSSESPRSLQSAVRTNVLVKKAIQRLKTKKPSGATKQSLLEKTIQKYSELLWLKEDIPKSVTNKVMSILNSKLDSWDFDIFQLVELNNGPVLELIGGTIMDYHNLPKEFNISYAILRNFLIGISDRYLNNPYHNSSHSADVTQTLHYFLTTGKLAAYLHPKAKLATIIAALVHDVGHMGITNHFYIATNHDLAVRYAYRSPLEHMHCAIAFEVMRSPDCDILKMFPMVQQAEIRNLILEAVLATDASVHGLYLRRFEVKLKSNGDKPPIFQLGDHQDEKLLLQIALRVADVSNPSKPFHIYDKWKDRIMKEFYAQGDKERDLSLPVSPGFDRHNPVPIEKMQAGFIIGIVRPVFVAFSQIPRIEISQCMESLDQNLAYWKSRIEEKKTQETDATAHNQSKS